VLFVCAANLCRSPTAHAILRRLCADRALDAWVAVHSAGTHGHRAGEAPDPRSLAHAARRGYDLSDLRARQITEADVAQADLVLVMDMRNLQDVLPYCPPAHRAKVRPVTAFCRQVRATDVEDPYRGTETDFEQVLDVLEDACEGLVQHLLALRGRD
jgi:protein-tyrosine phosphatase